MLFKHIVIGGLLAVSPLALIASDDWQARCNTCERSKQVLESMNRNLTKEQLENRSTIAQLTKDQNVSDRVIVDLQEKLIAEKAKKQPWFGTKATIVSGCIIATAAFAAILVNK